MTSGNTGRATYIILQEVCGCECVWVLGRHVREVQRNMRRGSDKKMR